MVHKPYSLGLNGSRMELAWHSIMFKQINAYIQIYEQKPYVETELDCVIY